MSYQNLTTFLNRKLWYQLGKSIQELLILIKNSKQIYLKNRGEVWFLFGKSAFNFFQKFNFQFLRNILNPISFLLMSGIAKHEIFFVEDRISFIQREFLKNKENLCFSTGETLIWSVLIFSETFLAWDAKTYKWINQINLLKNANKEDFFLEILVSLSELELNKKRFFIQNSLDSFNFLSSKRLKPRKLLIKAEKVFRKTLKNNQLSNYIDLKFLSEIFPIGKKIFLKLFSSLDWDKKNWVSDLNLVRSREKIKNCNCFFEKSLENFLSIPFFDWMYKKKISETTDLIFNAKKSKDTLRFSKIGKFIGFSYGQVEMSLLNISRNFSWRISLNQKRQILKKKEIISPPERLLPNILIKKNLLFLKKFKKLSLLNAKLKRNI
jgi:hypothetical protein